MQRALQTTVDVATTGLHYSRSTYQIQCWFHGSWSADFLLVKRRLKHSHVDVGSYESRRLLIAGRLYNNRLAYPSMQWMCRAVLLVPWILRSWSIVIVRQPLHHVCTSLFGSFDHGAIVVDPTNQHQLQPAVCIIVEHATNIETNIRSIVCSDAGLYELLLFKLPLT